MLYWFFFYFFFFGSMYVFLRYTIGSMSCWFGLFFVGSFYGVMMTPCHKKLTDVCKWNRLHFFFSFTRLSGNLTTCTKEIPRTFFSIFFPLAAIDYIVDESDVFIIHNNENMAKILADWWSYVGHKRTVRPNAKRHSKLLMAMDKMDWDTFAKKV